MRGVLKKTKLTGVALSDRLRREEEAVCVRERVVGETVQLAVHLSLSSRALRYQASVSPVAWLVYGDGFCFFVFFFFL